MNILIIDLHKKKEKKKKRVVYMVNFDPTIQYLNYCEGDKVQIQKIP